MGLNLRLGDSASQTAIDENLSRYARHAATYICKLEAKIRALEQCEEQHGDCPLTRSLAEDVERHVAENDQPDMPGDGIWGAEECKEWELWKQEQDGQGEIWEQGWDEWEEDAQPPSTHLQEAARAASCSNLAALPAPPAPPAPAAAAAKAPTLINSTTHRKEYMRLVPCLDCGVA